MRFLKTNLNGAALSTTKNGFAKIRDSITNASSRRAENNNSNGFSVEDVQRRVAEGWQFMAIQSELKMMVSRAQEFVSELGLSDSGDLARY